MNDSHLLGPWVRRFLAEYLVTIKSVARSTQLSYRDTLARLIRFAVDKTSKRADLLTVEDLNRDLLLAFLPSTTTKRCVGPRTVNQRLAALHSFARFVGEYGPEHLQWSGRVMSIPFRKFASPQISYLEKPEMDALLAAADSSTSQGARDHALLLFLFNWPASTILAARIDSAVLLPEPSLLPHVICYLPDGPAGAVRRDEASEHGNAQGVDRSSGGTVPGCHHQ